MKKIAALFLCLVAGCTTTVGRFPLLSTKYNEISRVDLTQVEYHRDVEASDGRVWILFVPLGGAPTIERAVDGCLRSGFGDFMTSAAVDSFWWSCFFVSYESYRVRGDVGNSVGVGARKVGER